MALKPPPPPWEILQQIGDRLGTGRTAADVDKGMRSLAQSALSRLDMVSREEFDAQSEILLRTRKRVAELEEELAALNKELEALAPRD